MTTEAIEQYIPDYRSFCFQYYKRLIREKQRSHSIIIFHRIFGEAHLHFGSCNLKVGSVEMRRERDLGRTKNMHC